MNTIQQELRNGATIEEICKKYSIPFSELVHTFAKSTYAKKNTVTEKNIYPRGSKHEIIRRTGGKITSYGSYYDLKEAIQVRNKLRKLNWNVDENEYFGDKYIFKTTKKQFRISKSYFKANKRVTESFGVYSSLNDARKVRDCLVKFEWDKDYLNLICKKLGVKRIGY